MTDVLRVAPDAPDPAIIRRAAECLRRGGLVAFPTETVYGLGVHALDRDAVRRLFEAKGRPANDPLIVHIATADQLDALVLDVPPAASLLAARFWPGPLTLVLRRSASVPTEVTSGLDTVAVRVPAHPVARALLEAAAIPVAAPSANLFSRPSPTRAAHVLEDLQGRIDMVLDAGDTSVGVESTVLDLAADPPAVLRPGAVTVAQLREVLPDVRVVASIDVDRDAMRSPGLLAKHYSPRAVITLYEGDRAKVIARLIEEMHTAIDRNARVGLLLTDEDHEAVAQATRSDAAAAAALAASERVQLGSERDLAAIAMRLYGALRELDGRGVDLILARAVTAREGLGLAIDDRLRRAAAGRIVDVDVQP